MGTADGDVVPIIPLDIKIRECLSILVNHLIAIFDTAKNALVGNAQNGSYFR